MTKETNDNKRFSRRTIVQGAFTLSGVAAAASLDAKAASAQGKLAQAIAKYQGSPKNGQECSTCVNFVAPTACQIVASPISPHGWCQFYAKKAA